MLFEKNNSPLDVIQDPVCVHLRSKGMFITGSMNPEADDPEIGDGHCWCNQTQNVFGPDHLLVDRQECNRARTCYQPSP